MENSQGIQVTFLDQTGAKSIKAKISPTVKVKAILPAIITKMNLPATAPDGTPMSYSLDWKEGGKRLDEDKVLPEQGIQEGAHLIVYPEIVAGAEETQKPALNKADKIVGIVVVVLLSCVCVRTALEAAASLVLPVVLVAAAYGLFRLWQTGMFAKLASKMEKKA